MLSVCLFVCLSVNTITLERVEIQPCASKPDSLPRGPHVRGTQRRQLASSGAGKTPRETRVWQIVRCFRPAVACSWKLAG